MKRCVFFVFFFFSSFSYASSYHIFSTLEDAYSYFNILKKYPNLVSRENLHESLSPNDKKALLAQQILEDVYEGYRGVYPYLTRHNIPPKIVVVKGKKFFASVLWDGLSNNEKIPYLLLISEDFLTNPNMAWGVLAHEMAHLLMNHVGKLREGQNQNLFRFSSKGPLSHEYLSSVVNSYSFLGPEYDDSMERLPMISHDLLDFSLGKLFLSLMKMTNRELSNRTSCNDAYKLFIEREEYLNSLYSFLSQKIEWTPSSKLKNSDMGKKLNEHLSECFKGEKIPFNSLMAESLGLDERSFEQLSLMKNSNPLFTEGASYMKNLYNQGENSFEGFLKIVNDFHYQFEKVKGDLDLSTIHSKTYEDEADEAAIKVMKRKGISHEGLEKFLLRKYPEECLELIEKDVTPPFGNLLDPHHSSCWRVWRNRKLL